MDTDMAVKAGRMAARMGKPLSSCPYDPDAGGGQAVMALGFVRGWRAGQAGAASAGSPARSLLAAFDRNGDPSAEDIAGWARAAGTDTHPGGEDLKHWALHTPEGLSKWATKEHPWTELYHFLLEKMDGNEHLAKLTASRWFIDHFGYSAGSDIHRVKSGLAPRGEKIGPG